MNLHSVNSGHFKLDGGAMFGVVPKTIWSRSNPPDENNMCSWAMRCMLVEMGNRLILIDTGMGNKQSEKFYSYYYLHGNDTLENSIREKGYSSDDVTDVFLTHLHFDHGGGALKFEDSARKKIVPAFPSAKYWVSKQQWEWATHPNAREKASFLLENIFPLQELGYLNFIEEGGTWMQDFEIIKVDGHTEGMMLPLIHYKGKKVLFCADLIPSIGHIPLPYVMGYDVRPLQTLIEKQELLLRAVREDWVLFFEHDPTHECCSLIETEKGIRMGEHFLLQTI